MRIKKEKRKKKREKRKDITSKKYHQFKVVWENQYLDKAKVK
jgi:hypothetical protein